VPYRVIADHGRAATFLVADGLTPGNEGRAYVLRMILRRAIRFGRRAGFREPFLGEIARVVIDQFGEQSPELARRREFIVKVITGEEERFAQTLSSGLDRLAEVVDAVRAKGEAILPGADVFRLYDTYGFPLEMTRDVAAEAGLHVDEAGFRQAMEEQRQRSRAVGTLPGDARRGEVGQDALNGVPATVFVGYTRETATARVEAVLRDGARAGEAGSGDDVVVVLDRTPFYAEAGGQVGDVGTLAARGLLIEIADTRRLAPGVSGHIGRMTRGRVREGMRVRATIDGGRRAAIKRNHTATHLLHQALQEILGEHAHQAGSLVAPDRLRFDFTHAAPLAPDEVERVERRVNEMVLAARPVGAATMLLEQARRLGAKALFGEKYGEHVRVVTVKGFSRELCGGTHVRNTGEIGSFIVASEGSVASGIRRIEAVTGWAAFERAHTHEELVGELTSALQATPGELPVRVRRLAEQVRTLERERRERAGAVDDSAAGVRASVKVGDVQVTVQRIDGAGHEDLRLAGDRLRRQAGEGVFVLGAAAEGRVNLVAMVTPDLHGRGIRADELIRAIAGRVGGTGGGRADLAQGGGKEASRLDQALDAVPDEVRRLMEAGPGAHARH
jgi:alanyl-tRNA synthetase